MWVGGPDRPLTKLHTSVYSVHLTAMQLEVSKLPLTGSSGREILSSASQNDGSSKFQGSGSDINDIRDTEHHVVPLRLDAALIGAADVSCCTRLQNARSKANTAKH